MIIMSVRWRLASGVEGNLLEIFFNIQIFINSHVGSTVRPPTTLMKDHRCRTFLAGPLVHHQKACTEERPLVKPKGGYQSVMKARVKYPTEDKKNTGKKTVTAGHKSNGEIKCNGDVAEPPKVDHCQPLDPRNLQTERNPPQIGESSYGSLSLSYIVHIFSQVYSTYIYQYHNDKFSLVWKSSKNLPEIPELS